MLSNVVSSSADFWANSFSVRLRSVMSVPMAAIPEMPLFVFAVEFFIDDLQSRHLEWGAYDMSRERINEVMGRLCHRILQRVRRANGLSVTKNA